MSFRIKSGQFKKNKYGVSAKEKRTVDGILFDSKKEADYYRKLKQLKKSGELVFFYAKFPLISQGESSTELIL